MDQSIILAIVSSSFITGIFVASIAGIFSLRTKQNEYINDYYKSVIKRRLQAYEIIEHVIRGYKTTLFDEDHKPYYIVFDDDTNWENAYAPLVAALSNSLWLGDDILEKTKELAALLFHLPSMPEGITQFGKINYIKIAQIRDDLETQLAIDMLELHKVEKFLKQRKEKKHGFHEVNLANVMLGRKNPNSVYMAID